MSELKEASDKYKGNDEKKSRAATTTREMLIKQHSVGSSEIKSEDRIYLTIHCPFSDVPLFLFFSKRLSLGQMLDRVATGYSQSIFDCPIRPADEVLLITNMDLRNHSVPLSEALSNFDNIVVERISVSDLIRRNTDLNEAAAARIEDVAAEVSNVKPLVETVEEEVTDLTPSDSDNDAEARAGIIKYICYLF